MPPSVGGGLTRSPPSASPFLPREKVVKRGAATCAVRPPTKTTVAMTTDTQLDTDESLLPPWPTFPLWKVVVLVAAFGFLAGAFGYWLATPGAPGEKSVEAGFYRDMIHHHNQAVAMAVFEQANGTDPVVVGFATEIIRRQSFEIGVMFTKLGEWGYTTAPNDTAMAWMHEPVPLAAMPGLATAEEMKQLRAATGATADALFLQLMSNHHRGGVHMATFAYEHADSAQVRDLAQLMAYMQATEINEFHDTALRTNINVTIEPQPVTVPNPSTGSS